jgi:RNA polymerase sigma-54 factor
VCRKLGETCLEKIKHFDPKPGHSFDGRISLATIAGIEVRISTDSFEVVPISSRGPEIHISATYRTLIRHSQDEAILKYHHTYITRAKNLIYCVEQRRNVIKRCAEEIVGWQFDYFKNHGAKRPMTLAISPKKLGTYIHRQPGGEGKYVLCGRGVYSLEHLFTREITTTSGNKNISASWSRNA